MFLLPPAVCSQAAIPSPPRPPAPFVSALCPVPQNQQLSAGHSLASHGPLGCFWRGFQLSELLSSGQTPGVLTVTLQCPAWTPEVHPGLVTQSQMLAVPWLRLSLRPWGLGELHQLSGLHPCLFTPCSEQGDPRVIWTVTGCPQWGGRDGVAPSDWY